MGKPSGALTLQREARLRRASDFQLAFREGRRVERASLVALWRRTPGERKTGFTVSRQVRGAVRRNRARRRLKEACRRLSPLLPPGLTLVFVARPPALTRPFADLLTDMREVISILTEAGRVREAGSRAPENSR